MIRRASIGDTAELVILAAKFFNDGDYWGKRRELDFDTFSGHVVNLIQSPIAAVFVAENDDGSLAGAIAILIMPDIFTGELIAMKLHWFAHGGLGLRLERIARTWAIEQGATEFKLSAINEKSANLIERLGYTRTEIIYSKAI